MLVAPDTVRAIIAEAHRLGMTVTGHVPTGMTAESAVQAGFDQLAHMPIRGRPGSDEATIGIAFFRQNGTVLDPTQSWGEFLGRSAATPLSAIHPDINRLPPVLARQLDSVTPSAGDPAAIRARQLDSWRLLRQARDAGVPVVAGTDKGVPGFSLPREIEIYVEGGMTPLQAIQAATIVPARAMKLDKELGTIEVGKRADLVVLDGNPLDRIANVRAVRWVVANGRLYDSAALWRAARLHAQHRAQLLAFDHFLLEQPLGQLIEHVAPLGEDAPRLGFGRADEALDLGVDEPRGLLGVDAALGRRPAPRGRRCAAGLRGSRARSARSCRTRSPSTARCRWRACRSFCAPVESSPNTIHSAARPPSSDASSFSSSALRLQVPVFGRQLHRVARARRSRADDRDLVHRIEAGQRRSRTIAWPDFVDGDRGAASRGFIARFFSRPGDDAIDGLVEVAAIDGRLVAPGGEQRGFVHQVREVGAREAAGARGDHARGPPIRPASPASRGSAGSPRAP